MSITDLIEIKNMVSVSLSIEEAEYLKSLVTADVETRENKGPFQQLAISVFNQVVIGRPTVVANTKGLQMR